MLTLVKFISNEKQKRGNPIITRSLGKIGVIDSSIWDRMLNRPRSDEFWYVEILKEVGDGTRQGCFILKPIKKIGTTKTLGYLAPDIHRLIPGTFKTVKKANSLLIYPHKVNGIEGPNWILDSETKAFLRKKLQVRTGEVEFDSVIVVFDERAPEPIPGAHPLETDAQPIIDLDDIGS
jgi:hypothetical protein